jgi:hypothetical protein
MVGTGPISCAFKAEFAAAGLYWINPQSPNGGVGVTYKSSINIIE